MKRVPLWQRIIYAIIVAMIVIGMIGISVTYGKTLDELRVELQDKKDGLKEAQDKIEEFRQNIQQKKREATTLQDQIGLIDDNIGELEIAVEQTAAQIEETAAEIAVVEAEIRVKEEEIAAEKKLLAEYIRSIHNLDQQSTVSTLLKYASFSEVVRETATFTELHNRAQQTLTLIQALKNELEEKGRDLEDFKETLEALWERQEGQRNILAGQRDSKERLLELTNAQEAKFKDLLKQSQEAHQAAQAEIKQIDTLIREEIKKQGIGSFASVGIFTYPIEIKYGTSCGFHCSGYPYAYLIGPHAGIDWPASPGTPIVAAADGYVARARDSGGPGYSYIMLIHGDGSGGEKLSTVYGHMSSIAVNEGQVVTRGSIIGYSGGSPGSRGSGLSSGPHLHFEVRANGVPVNPLNYL